MSYIPCTTNFPQYDTIKNVWRMIVQRTCELKTEF